MKFTILLIASLVSVFYEQAVDGQQAADPSYLLSIYPYRSFGGFPKPAQINSQINEQLYKISCQYSVPIDDLYQWYTLVNVNVPSWSPTVDISIVNQLAAAVSEERALLGLQPPYVDCSIPPVVFDPLNPYAAYMPTLQKREPIVGSLVDDTTANMASVYDSMANTASHYFPETSESLSNTVSDIVEGTEETVDYAEDLASSLTDNIRYSLSDMIRPS